MKRIHLHWTAGADGINQVEDDHYHFIVERDGTVVSGKHVPEDNIPPLNNYAAHTYHANSYAIGVSLDAMAGAVERPFDPGSYPITEVQLEAMASLVGHLAEKYGIPITRETVLTHAEVEPTLGIKQKWKWDITWLPGMDKPGDPVEVGDRIRAMIAGADYVAPAEPEVHDTIQKRGRKGPHVTVLQERLVQLGAGIAIDGDFGPATEAAVRVFQRENDLGIDGIVGPNTWAALGFG